MVVAIRRTGAIAGAHRQWTVRGLSVAAVTALLGFEPIDDTDDTFPFSWDFVADGQPCSVWASRGRIHLFGAFGPEEPLRAIFGDNLT